MQTDTKARKPIQQVIQPRFFLKAIDDGGSFSADYRRLYDRPDTLTGQSVAHTWQQRLASVVSPSPGTGGELVAALLREYTDEWLATGIDDGGREAPYTRKLTSTKSAMDAVRWYEATRFFGGIDWDGGLERRPRRVVQELTVSVAEKNAAAATLTMKTTATGLQRQNKRRLAQGGAYSKMPENVVEAAEIRAKGIFHALMAAPWRYQLAQCKRCYRYFTLDIRPSKAPYIRGMHCRACKSIASAEASAKVKRAQREEQLFGLAAQVWPAWRPDPDLGERNEWVAKQVSKLLGEVKAIQKNWVTRHEADIIAKVKETAHGKG